MIILKFINVILIMLVLLIVKNVSANTDDNCENNFKNYLEGGKKSWPAHALYILNSEDPEHQIMTTRFIAIANTLGFVVKVIEQEKLCEDGLNATRAVANIFDNVINLKTKVPQDYEDHVLPIVGYIGKYHDPEQNKTTVQVCDIKENLNELDNLENVETVNVTGNIYEKRCENVADVHVSNSIPFDFVKIASQSIENYPFLYQILLDFSAAYKKEDYPYWKKGRGGYKHNFEKENILVCLTKNTRKDLNDMNNIHINLINNCQTVEEYQVHKIAAALVAKPLVNEEKTNLPVVFYDMPFLLDEHKDVYPNGIVLYNDYFGLLSQSLIHLLTNKKWDRVVMLSDESKYSEDFESRMLNLFKRYGITFAIRRLTNTSKAKEVSQWLQKYTLPIIINVEQDYESLIKDVIRGSSSRLMWIWRDWPSRDDFNTQAYKLGGIQNVYSITVGPDFASPGYPYIRDNIRDAVTKIKKALHRHDSSAILTASQIQSELNARTSARVNLRHMISGQSGKPEVVFSIQIKDSQVNLYESNNNKIQYQDPLRSCTFKGKQLDSLCEDIYVIIIICIFFFVVIMFLLTYIFIQKFDHRPRNYQTL